MSMIVIVYKEESKTLREPITEEILSIAKYSTPLLVYLRLNLWQTSSPQT